MGGSSKKQTVGYKYYLGMHMILCHGPADMLSRIEVDKRRAWTGDSPGGRVNISAEGLFGGKKREGGISGAIDVEMGASDQVANDYLISQLGAEMPAFRGVVGIVLRQCYLGNNPYLKRWAFRLTRIHKRKGGEVQWYDAKAEIPPIDLEILRGLWQYQVIPFHSNPGYEQLAVPSSGWQGFAKLPFTNTNIWLYPTPSGWPTPQLSVVWIRKTVTNIPAGIVIQLRAENGCMLWINGEYIGASNRDNLNIPGNDVNPVNFVVPVSGTYEIVGKAFTEDNTGSQGGNTLSITLDSIPAGGDMNPAHMIRECLTDPIWGMGYQEADIDDVSFMAAADTLYEESLGMSITWSKQMPIEDFIQEVVKHINATLYVERTSGKFALKLIRDDYDVETILALGEADISKVDNVKRPTTGELVNSVTVNYWDAFNGVPASLTTQDPALIQMEGSVINTTIQYPGFTNSRNASTAALRNLRAYSTPLLSCSVTATRKAAALNIGDVFKLTWPDLGIYDLVMRVQQLALGDGVKNAVKITAVEDAFRSQVIPQTITTPVDTWEDPNSPPMALEHGLVLEAPYFYLVQELGQATVETLLAEAPETGFVLAAAAQPGSALNAALYVDSGAGYEDSATLDFCPFGKLSASASRLDTSLQLTDTLDMDQLGTTLHVQIGSELMRVDSYDSVTGELMVGRGVLDTVPARHAEGAKVFFWDIFAEGDATEYVSGESIDLQVRPITGQGMFPTDEVRTVVLNSRALRPYAPGNFKINNEYFPNEIDISSGLIDVSWAHRDRVQQTSATLIDFLATDVGPEAGVTYLIEVYSLYPVDPPSLFYSINVGAVTSFQIDLNTNVPTAGFAELEIRLYAVRDGVLSYQFQNYIVSTLLAPYGLTAVYTE